MDVKEKMNCKSRFEKIRNIYKKKRKANSVKEPEQNSHLSFNDTSRYFFLKKFSPKAKPTNIVFPCEKSSLLYISSQHVHTNLLFPMHSIFTSDNLNKLKSKLSHLESKPFMNKKYNERQSNVNKRLQNKEKLDCKSHKINGFREKSLFASTSEEILKEKYKFLKNNNQFIKYPLRYKKGTKIQNINKEENFEYYIQ